MDTQEVQKLSSIYSKLPDYCYLCWKHPNGTLMEVNTICYHNSEETYVAYFTRDSGGGYADLDNAEFEDFKVMVDIERWH